MDISELWNEIVIDWGSLQVTLGRLISMIVLILGIMILAWLLVKKAMPKFYDREDTSAALKGKALAVTLGLVILGVLIVLLNGLELDPKLIDNAQLGNATINIRVSTLLKGLLAFWLAMLFDWLIQEYLTQRYHKQENIADRAERNFNRFRSLRPVLYTLAIIYFANLIGLADYRFFSIGSGEQEVPITLRKVLSGLLIIFSIRLFIRLLIGFAFKNYYERKQLDQGSQYAVNRLFTYFAYLIGVLIVLNVSGLDLVGLWAGAAALLVGIGIGLQQTFNDLICGIIILFERSVKVGDVLNIAGTIGTVRKIGTRTSVMETRENIIIYVPNSKLIGENVVNWSQTERKARFHITVGVAYGSDTDLVKKVLVETAKSHRSVLKFPAPWVRFIDFGNSSLDFELLFFSREFLRIEDVKSDLRFAVDQAFRENEIEIPFPQRDLWLRGGKGIDKLTNRGPDDN
ncbi:MAG: mechanosensitive ion channel domain-containing protein [Bacteroidota bacterium]